ncbi:hypothetical protein F4808DRAFT_427468 [Astrocystis sublimbata]|nr:hypothetical protein F4808DRAFT_427468 [Astrocystis sublimbata]
MDARTIAQQARVEAKAVGRTPEEHAALERALARRRAARLSLASLESGTHPRPHLHPPAVDGDDGRARSQPLDTRGFQGSALENHHEASPAAEVPEYLHEIDDSEIYNTFLMMHDGLENPSVSSRSSFYFDYAMFRAKVAAAKSNPSLPALGVPPERKSKPKYSMRDARGAGWHKRGYRDHGSMWINVRAGSHGHTRGMDAPENERLADFVTSVFHTWASQYPEGWYCDLYFRKKSVTRLLVDLENCGLDMDLVLVKDYFDGGETIYFKLFDEDGEQRSQGLFG